MHELIHRDIWLQNRLNEFIEHLKEYASEYNEYNVEKIKEIANEIIYLTTEWNKYYKDL